MAFILKKKDPMDTLSTRWIEPVEGLRLKVASSAKDGYVGDYRQVQRHIDASARQYGVGTQEFSILKESKFDVADPDMLVIELACKHLIIDWEGVAEAEDPEKPAPYTPERGVLLIEQLPEVYFLVLQAANAIAMREKEIISESVGKPSKPIDGPSSGRARKTRTSAKSTKSSA